MKTTILIPLATFALAAHALAAEMHTVTFRRMNGTVLSRVRVAHGEPAPVPQAPDESGYTFKGWDNTNKVSSVTQDISCWALYEKGGFPDTMKGIDSKSIAAREQPYTLDELFRLYDHVAWGDEFGEASVKENFYGQRPQQRGVLSRTMEANRVVEGGLLKLRCKREDSGNYHFTSGEITTAGKVTFYKGRIEIRAKLNYARGTWPSFWTMNSGWSSYNEIDVFEQLSGSDWIGGTLHVGSIGSIMSSNHTAPEDGVRFRDGFHRIGAIVTDRELIWYVDDHIFKRMDITESPWNGTPSTAKYLLLCSGICAGGWLGSLGPELGCATAADIPGDFMVDDYEIDYMRIYTNTNADNTVAYDAPPAAAKLSAPVRATVWRGYDMNYGKTGQDFTGNVNTGYDVGYYVNTALRQHFGRDKADVVAFLSPTDDPDTELKSAFDIPGTSAVFVDSKYRYDNGKKNEESRNGFVFDSSRFDPAEAGAETFVLSGDGNFTNCYAACLDLKERATGARVKVVGVNVIATNGVEKAGGAVAKGFDALFAKLNSMKDDNVILFIQGWGWDQWHYLRQRAATELDAKFRIIGERDGAWPNYQSAYATANVSATAAVPADLAIPYKDLSASKTHRPGALQATVLFDGLPRAAAGYAKTADAVYAKALDVTFSGYSGSALENFPVLVKLSTGIDGFSYADFAMENGGDLRFTDASGNLLPHEIDTWNTNGVSTAWVKVPLLTRNATVTAHWGCANPPAVDSRDVWDDDYVGVWHLGESALPMKESSGTTSDFKTSTGNGIAYAAAGIVGGSVDFSDAGNCALVAPDHDLLDGFDKFTIEVWTIQDELKLNAGVLSKRQSYNSEAAYYILESGNAIPIYMATNKATQASWMAATYPTMGTWNHLAYAIDTTASTGNVRTYKNGTASTPASKTFPGPMLANTCDLVLGNLNSTAAYTFNGRIDEVRISKCVRSPDWIKATHDTMALANFATYAVDGVAQPSGADIASLKLKASTDKANPIDYAVGEAIRFDFRLDGVEALPSSLHDRLPLCVVWERTGDDGVTARGTNVISLAQGCSMSTSLAVPGCVRVEAYLAGSDGQKLAYATSSGDTASITFSGGAGVATGRMQLSAEEPADFDAFWIEAKAKLAAVQFNDGNVVLEEIFPSNASAATLGAYHFYAAKIPCLGPRPVTGWLVVPKNAAPGSLSVRATFAGYGCATATPSPPNWGLSNEIRFEVNAHGYDLVGQNDQYYRDFNDSINKTGRTFGNTTYTYGLAPQDYDNPTNTYFYYMALRVVRAFDYLKSRPEWDGTNVVAEGGSQGGLQTMWAGGLVDGISRIKPSITWGCDIGCQWNGKGPYPSRTWGIPCVPGAYYFDAALHARRVPVSCTASIERIGMGDYTCPPRGILLSYYGMRCPVTATLVQGSTHGYIPPQPNQTFVISKAAVTNEPVATAATEADGLDWTNRLFTVSGLASGTEVTLTLTAPDGSLVASAEQTADASGSVSFAPATTPGSLYTYVLSADGETIASGSFLAGAWDANGAWFSAAPDGNGGSTETGGAWTLPPEETNATAYVVGAATAFTLTEAARAAGTGKVIRAETALRYDFLNEASDTFSDLELANTLAAVTAVTNSSAGGSAQWKACVGGDWVALDGGISPAPGIDYLLRLEGDFAAATPRVRLSVSDDGGASYATLSATDTGAEWLIPNDAGAMDFTGIATDGAGNVAALRGQLSNVWVAETGGVRYASLADALRAAGKGGTVTLLTGATAPASLAAGRAIVANGHLLVTYNDWHGAMLFMQ